MRSSPASRRAAQREGRRSRRPEHDHLGFAGVAGLPGPRPDTRAGSRTARQQNPSDQLFRLFGTCSEQAPGLAGAAGFMMRLTQGALREARKAPAASSAPVMSSWARRGSFEKHEEGSCYRREPSCHVQPRSASALVRHYSVRNDALHGTAIETYNVERGRIQPEAIRKRRRSVFRPCCGLEREVTLKSITSRRGR